MISGTPGVGKRKSKRASPDVLKSATNLVSVHEIDALLERRQRAPIADDVVQDADIDPNDLHRAGPVFGQTRGAGALATESDVVKAHVDVYGVPPPAVALRDERIAALEEAIRSIPIEHRGGLEEALRRNPLLLVTSTHAKLIVEDECFDPHDAARRLARYWEHRAEIFGSRAFSEGVFTVPTFDDYLRYYDKCLRICNSDADTDTNADADRRDIASEYVRCVHMTKICAMDQFLQSVSPEDRAPLLEAQARSPEVAASDEMKLNFLRCEDFVEAKAAERMLGYWKAKKLVFGPDQFHRRTTLADMDSHILDLEHYKSIQFMKKPDSHGRTILALFSFDFLQEDWTESSVAKYLFYLVDSALENEECRLNGYVLFLDYRRYNHSSEELIQNISHLRETGRNILLYLAPVKLRAIHIWFRPESWWQHIFVGIFTGLQGFFINRVVIHAGTDEENIANLEDKYKIPRDLVPIRLGGEASCDDWTDWLEQRRRNDL